jgi:uroporphyrinogen III methyltransferase/synthase
VVLYDYLVNPQLLAHCRANAQFICLGQHGRTEIWPQEKINEHLLRFAGEGKIVVRLKSGDPAIFARGAEEAAALVRAGIPFEIVPGITSALATGSYAGIPLTHRERASAVALVTGQEQSHKAGPSLDYASLASFPGTLIIYMGVTTAAKWSTQLMVAGKSPETPVAIVHRCSFADQRTIRCTLATVAAEIAAQHLRPPAIIVVGEVAAASESLAWFDRRPLFGQRIIVTRPREQAAALADPLAELGAEVHVQPAIEIRDPADWQPVDDALTRLSQFDWLVFSSANGVRQLLDRLPAIGRDVRALGSLKLAAIGPGTDDELRKYHLTADLLPDEFRAESLAAALAGSARGQRFLLARASRGREVLADELTRAGGIVEQIVVYQSLDVELPDPAIEALLQSGQIDWITVTSSAIARSLVSLFGSALFQAKLASISPITSATLRDLGHQPDVEATHYTIPSLLHAILRHSPK